MSNLFLDGIYNGRTSPSSVVIGFPVLSSESQSVTEYIQGLLVSEPNFSAKNSWGPLISNLDTLSEVSQLASSENVAAYVGAATQAWKGTSPIEFSVEFYLINYKRGLRLEEKLTNFVKLASLYASGAVSVKVHGGYHFDVTATNTDMDVNKGFFGGWTPGGDLIKDLTNDLAALGKFSNTVGTCTVVFGNAKMTIKDVLLARLDVSSSNTEVPDQRPLYYRVSASFVGTKPLRTEDVDGIFK